MSVETDLFTTLRSLVSDRVYPQTFEQPSGTLPLWPAIRYTVTNTVPVEDLCGDGDDETADIYVQIDAVDETYSKMRSLRLEIMESMRSFPTPARLSGSLDVYDVETKTHRAILSYTISGSSSEDSPP